jgi:hypothetical protein
MRTVDEMSQTFLQQSWRALVGVGAVLFTLSLLYVGTKFAQRELGYDTWKSYFRDNHLWLFGVPAASVAAFGLVVFFEVTSDESIEMNIWGLELKGPAAPLTMWVVVFLALVLALKVLSKK